MECPVRFRFVFSTGTCFQQLLRFVFRFAPVRFLARSFVFNNLSGSFLKKGILFCFLPGRTGIKIPFALKLAIIETREFACHPHTRRHAMKLRLNARFR